MVRICMLLFRKYKSTWCCASHAPEICMKVVRAGNTEVNNSLSTPFETSRKHGSVAKKRNDLVRNKYNNKYNNTIKQYKSENKQTNTQKTRKQPNQKKALRHGWSRRQG